MNAPALIAIWLAEGVLGLTARERWQAMQQVESGSANNRWFSIGMVLLLVFSAVALVVVTLLRKAREVKKAEKAFSDNAARKGLTESESDLLMAVAVKAGLIKAEAIFSSGAAFDSGSAALLKESLSAGKPTSETSRLEKQLADLRNKMGFRKAASAPAGAPARQSASVPAKAPMAAKPKASDSRPGETSWHETAFVALFPFSTKSDSVSQVNSQLPQFVPAVVTGLVGRVVSLETTLPANVGDRVLAVIGPTGTRSNGEQVEWLEDVGLVQQSAQPAQSMKEEKARRLSIALVGLEEAQIAQLAQTTGSIKKEKVPQTDTQPPEQTQDKSQPVAAKEQTN